MWIWGLSNLSFLFLLDLSIKLYSLHAHTREEWDYNQYCVHCENKWSFGLILSAIFDNIKNFWIPRIVYLIIDDIRRVFVTVIFTTWPKSRGFIWINKRGTYIFGFYSPHLIADYLTSNLAFYVFNFNLILFKLKFSLINLSCFLAFIVGLLLLGICRQQIRSSLKRSFSLKHQREIFWLGYGVCWWLNLGVGPT